MLTIDNGNCILGRICFGNYTLITLVAYLNGRKLHAIKWSDVYKCLAINPSSLINDFNNNIKNGKVKFNLEHRLMFHNHFPEKKFKPLFKTKCVGRSMASSCSVISIHLCAKILRLYINNYANYKLGNLKRAGKLLARIISKFPHEVFHTYENVSCSQMMSNIEKGYHPLKYYELHSHLDSDRLISFAKANGFLKLKIDPKIKSVFKRLGIWR